MAATVAAVPCPVPAINNRNGKKSWNYLIRIFELLLKTNQGGLCIIGQSPLFTNCLIRH